jgi:PAS domain S-box-containing protein
MKTREAQSVDCRVLVLSRRWQDGQEACTILTEVGISCTACADMRDLCEQLHQGAGTVLLTEDVLAAAEAAPLVDILCHQPRWSDLSVLLLTRSMGDSPPVAWATATLPNVVLLDLPIREHVLLSAARMALQARRRQYELRHYLDRQQRAEQALRESEARYRHLVDILPAPVYVTDRDGWITLFNEGAVQLWGRRPHVGIDRWFGALRIYWPDGKPMLLEECPLAVTLRKGQPVMDQEILVERPDGSRIHVVPNPAPIRDSSGQIVGAVNLLMDITHIRRAEQQLRDLNETLERRVAERTAEAEQRAEQLRALASELTLAEQRERHRLARVLHDHLQQLLVGMKLGTSVLRRQTHEPQLQEVVARLDDLLDQSIQASRSLTVELSPPILYEGGLVRALQWLAGWMLDKHRLQVEVAADEDANPASEDLRVLLYQAARELLFNVVKHAQTDRAHLEIRRSLSQNSIRIVVSDHGVGFDAVRAAAAPGSGFGLFSLRERLQILGGRLQVESRPGDGACVTLQVPAERDSSRLTLQPAAVPLSVEVVRSPAPAGEQIRILLADDHEIVRDGLVRLLRMQPDLAVVGEAGDGQAAIEQARLLLPDVILMDVSMPRVNGLEATRCITAELASTRIIGLSMHSETDMGDEMRQAGAAAFVSKSAPPDDLLAAIRACCIRP